MRDDRRWWSWGGDAKGSDGGAALGRSRWPGRRREGIRCARCRSRGKAGADEASDAVPAGVRVPGLCVCGCGDAIRCRWPGQGFGALVGGAGPDRPPATILSPKPPLRGFVSFDVVVRRGRQRGECGDLDRSDRGHAHLEPPANIDANSLSGVSCPSTSLCVAVDGFGNAVISTDPTAATPTWSPRANIDGTNPLSGVSCPSTSLCVAVDGFGNAVISTDPTAATPTWSPPANI